ncbi:MFS general substrate transporter, partial [Podospora aff. communis PSN243]
IDGGRQAWTFLIASVAVEGLLYGFQASYGVLLKFYRENASFGTHPFLPFVGLLSIGMQKLGAPVVAPFIIRHPQFRTHLIWSGWIVCVVSLVASSCASELWHLALSIGVAFSLGFSILYYPMLNMLNDWWYVRRGFAYGIQFGLAGVISTVLPFALAPLLEALGGSWTLLLYAGVTFIIGGPTVYLLRAPAKAQLSAPRILNKMDRSVFRQIGFTAMTLSNVFQGLVYSIPAVFLPVYASAVGLSSIQGTVILSVTNFAITVGQLGTGYLADIVDSRILMGVLPLLSALVVFVFWGPGQTLIRLVAFGLLFGLFSGGYIVLYTRFSTALADDRATQTWLYTIFDVQRGVAIIVGGAIGGGLVHGTINLGDYGAGEYKALIIFCGACFVASSLGGIGWFFRGRSFRVPRR